MLVTEMEDWFVTLDSDTANQVTAAISLLQDQGPTAGRPLVDRIKGSALHNMKELRPGSTGSTEVRVLFVFDPKRQAVLLVAGDKSGAWKTWYSKAIPLAEKRYQAHLKQIGP